MNSYVEDQLRAKFEFESVDESRIRKLEVLQVPDYSVEFYRIKRENLKKLFSLYFPNSTINLLYLFDSNLEKTPYSERIQIFYGDRNMLMFKIIIKLRFNVFNCYISINQYEDNKLVVQIDFEIFNAFEVNTPITSEERYQVNGFFNQAKELVLNFLINFPRLRFEQFSRGALDQGLNGDVLSVIGSFLGPVEEIVGKDINKNTSRRFQSRDPFYVPPKIFCMGDLYDTLEDIVIQTSPKKQKLQGGVSRKKSLYKLTKSTFTSKQRKKRTKRYSNFITTTSKKSKRSKRMSKTKSKVRK
jgi:hypothetical protein